MAGTVELRIQRCEGPGKGTTWEVFRIPHKKGMNVISALQEIRRNPVTAGGTTTTPVAWDCSCLEEVCGACTVLVNGKPRQACTALIPEHSPPIELRPLTKFPLIRDLMVDRSRMFDALKKVKAWIPIDGTYNLGPGPTMAESDRLAAYDFARCMTCGCCMEACPQYGPHSDFIGPAPLAQVRLFNAHPTGSMNANERMDAIMGPGGITDCGNAQNCLRACPKEIKLTDAIAKLGRDTSRYWLKSLFG